MTLSRTYFSDPYIRLRYKATRMHLPDACMPSRYRTKVYTSILSRWIPSGSFGLQSHPVVQVADQLVSTAGFRGEDLVHRTPSTHRLHDSIGGRSPPGIHHAALVHPQYPPSSEYHPYVQLKGSSRKGLEMLASCRVGVGDEGAHFCQRQRCRCGPAFPGRSLCGVKACRFVLVTCASQSMI